VSVDIGLPQSVTHGQCVARPTATFPAVQHCHCHLACTHFPSRWR